MLSNIFKKNDEISKFIDDTYDDSDFPVHLKYRLCSRLLKYAVVAFSYTFVFISALLDNILISIIFIFILVITLILYKTISWKNKSNKKNIKEVDFITKILAYSKYNTINRIEGLKGELKNRINLYKSISSLFETAIFAVATYLITLCQENWQPPLIALLIFSFGILTYSINYFIPFKNIYKHEIILELIIKYQIN